MFAVRDILIFAVVSGLLAAAAIAGLAATIVDPDTHHIYLPLANVGGQPVLRELVLEAPAGG